MSAYDAAGLPPHALAPAYAPAPPVVPGTGTGRFLGREGAFFGLLARGAILLMFTLGIYRFWLTTDVRRFLWGNTEIAGDGFEYTGTAKELLLGFLLAIVLLVPINALFFVGTLMPDLLPYSGTLGFVLLALLGQFAYYRARRYRLTRTIYRGVRFFQTGSGWRYSITANLWGVLILLTAGLAYPWAEASLERYKMRNTHFGNLSGHFEGSGTGLFFRGILLWLVVMGPFLAGLFIAATAINWVVLASAFTAPSADMWKRIETGNPDFATGLVWLIGGATWSVFAAILLYPLFRAIVMRWWISGLRIDGITATSRLRNGQVYRVYARFLGYSMLFGMAAGTALPLAGLFFYEVSKSIPAPDLVQIAAVVLLLIGYVMIMLGYSAIYQATVTIRLWRLSFEMTELAGLQALEHVEARGAASGPFGEGLADALDVGGI